MVLCLHPVKLFYSNVSMADPVAEHIDKGSILDNQIGRYTACRHINDPNFFGQFSIDPSGIAFVLSHGNYLPFFLR